jgi:outer membrane protein TolC
LIRDLRRPFPKRLALPILCLLLGTTAACVPPDSRPVFQPDFDRALASASEPSRKIPDFIQVEAEAGEDQTGTATEDPSEADLQNLTVEDAVLLALRHNRDLRVERLNPVIAGTFERIERGVFDPEVFAEAEFFEEETSETSRSTGEQFSVQGRETYGAVGVRQFLPTGTTVEGEIRQNRDTSNRSPEQQTARAGISVTQSLLRGFGPAVNLAAVRQAELGTRASLWELRGFAEAVLAETELAYWNYVLAEREIAIFQRSLELAKRQLDEIDQRIEVGVLPEIEAAAARAEVARREQALIDAQGLLEDRRLRLLRLLGIGRMDGEISAVSEIGVEPEPITDLPDRLRLAEQSRPDLGEARLRLEQDRLETIVTRNGRLPRLELFLDLGLTGFEDTFSGSFREMSGETFDVAAGVRLSQVLGNRTADARDDRARANRRQSAEAVANLEQFVRFEVRLAANEVERARRLIAATATTRALQEETVAAEQARLEVGASTAILVAQAQRDLLASQIAEVEALVTYREALIRLYLAEGSLLGRRGIKVGSTENREPNFNKE